MAAAMTYDSLVDDIQAYCERNDAGFVAQIPRLIMLAETRIAAEVKGLGLLRAVTDDLVASQQDLAKPARWRETVSLQTSTAVGGDVRNMLLLRTYEFCRTFWPDPTQTDLPVYYADWDYQHWLLAPTPDLAYSYELVYHERPEPLDDTHQTNWTTEYAPQLLLYACLLEAQPFLKNTERAAVWMQAYAGQATAISAENRQRMVDRSTLTTKGGQGG
jgi:hypothetical protein